MSQSIKLYTMVPMKQAIFNAGSPAGASGYAKENMLDGNPDTYYKPSTTSQPTFDWDLITAQTVDAVGFWIQNNQSSFASGSGNHIAHQFLHSADDITYSAAMSTANINNTAGRPIYITDITQATKRYWRINLTYPSGTPATYLNMSMIFILQVHDLGQGDEYPVNDSIEWNHRIIQGAGGRTFVKMINSAKQTKYNRSFIFNNATNYNALYNAIANSYGSGMPMILSLDGVAVDLVRFMGDFNINNVEYGQYQIGVIFQSIPYIPDGAIL